MDPSCDPDYRNTPWASVLRIAIEMATFVMTFLLKTQKEWRIAPENDYFVLKNGRIFTIRGTDRHGDLPNRRSENLEFCIKNEKLCIKNEENLH